MPEPVGRTYKIVAFRLDLLPDKISKNIGSLNGVAAHWGLALVDNTGKVYGIPGILEFRGNSRDTILGEFRGHNTN